MAWHSGQGKHQYRKEASAAQRSQDNLDALKDQENIETKPKKRTAAKPYGLQFYWGSFIGNREVHTTSWYPTPESRARAKDKAAKDAARGARLKFTRIVEIER